MEAQGAARFEDESVCVVKAICDYADDRKGKLWSPEEKMEVQLYASELAADFVSQLIRNGTM
jgi:hypothetical protein